MFVERTNSMDEQLCCKRTGGTVAPSYDPAPFGLADDFRLRRQQLPAVQATPSLHAL